MSGGHTMVVDEDGDHHMLNLDALKRGAGIMASKYTRHWQAFVSENDDAETSDVFLQCCLLDGIVYG